MITGIDAYGPYIDTGVAVAPTPRPSVEDETHFSGEIDTNSKNTVPVTTVGHIPHRHKSSPR